MKLKNFINYKIYYLHKRENGFSIVEMLIVVFIIAIIATVISILYISSVRSQRDLLNKAGSEANLRTTLYSMTKDIREATNVSIANYNKLEFTSGSDSIKYELIKNPSGKTFKLYKIVTKDGIPNTKFIMDYIISDNTFSYDLKDGLGENLPVLLTDQLSKLILVNLNFTVNKEPLAPAKAVILSTKVSLRNIQ